MELESYFSASILTSIEATKKIFQLLNVHVHLLPMAEMKTSYQNDIMATI